MSATTDQITSNPPGLMASIGADPAVEEAFHRGVARGLAMAGDLAVRADQLGEATCQIRGAELIARQPRNRLDAPSEN